MRQSWFGVMFLVGSVLVMTPLLVLAASGGQGFDAVVNGIEHRYHAHPTKIPFMGLVSGIARIATHGGVKNMHVAEFENFSGPVDGAEFNALVEERVGKGWSRMVRETSRSGDQQSLIFVRAEGDHVGMLVVDLDGHELDVVQMSLNPDQLAHQLSDHMNHHGKHSDHDEDGDESE
jgi:hypothetical protein